MIPAPKGLQAHYKREASGGTARSTTRDVLAFADEGTPLVLGGENHGWGLVPASAYPGFTGIYPGDMPLPNARLPARPWRWQSVSLARLTAYGCSSGVPQASRS